MLGFGGPHNSVISCGCSSLRYLSDLWVFDLGTRRSSRVRESGKRHFARDLTALVVQGGALYLLGGGGSCTIHALPLAAPAGLIRSRAVRNAFRLAAGLPVAPRAVYGLGAWVITPPPWL